MKLRNFMLNATLAGLTLLFGANLANAGDVSIGISAARATVTVQESGMDISGDASGYRIFGQYMFNKNFGIEGGMSSYGKPNDNSIPSNMQVETEAYDLYAVAAYPMSEKAGFFAKVGFAAWNTETEVNDTNETHHKSTDLALSLGGQYDFTEHFGVRTEYEWFDHATSGAEDVVSISGVFRFK